VYSAGTRGELIVWNASPPSQAMKFTMPLPSHARWDQVLDQFQFSQDGKLLIIAGPGKVSFWKSRTGEPAGTVLTDGTIISPSGHFRSGKKANDGFVYVVETTDGQQLTLDATSFKEQFGWNNDPSKVHLLTITADATNEDNGDTK
jgi:hypothetical protein